MSIRTENVKLLASQRLTDKDDGGGFMTGKEILDGNVNNLFPDISRLDRVYGRVSLRKAFVNVQTADTETYSGAHVILSAPAKDPNVSVCMFTTGNPADMRTAARDRVESYVTVGPRYPGWLWGDQPAGSRSLLMFQVKGSKIPDIGSVLCLFKDKGTAKEKIQYVRVTGVELSSAEFNSTSDSSEYGAQAMAFNRDILKVEIGDPLRETFPGIEINNNDSKPTNVYTTTVSDAAKYYGVMLPKSPISKGDIAVNVDSIFANLVPSAQGEAPMVDLSVGEAGPITKSGNSYALNVSDFRFQSGAQVHFGRGIVPGTLKVTNSGGADFVDDANGLLMAGSDQLGTVDYATGVLTFAGINNPYNTHLNVTADIGVEVTRVPSTGSIPIELSNRGYNYTRMLDPLPLPGTVWVDFMSQGKWYRLRDDGKGTLVPDIKGTGTGRVEYNTGSLIVTCGALPDVDTDIMISWANPVETVNLSGESNIDVAEVSHTVENAPVKPGSLSITWPTGPEKNATATDDGTGKITGDAGGWINYTTGELAFTPTALPQSDGEYTVNYLKYPRQNGSLDIHKNGNVTFDLPNTGPIKPGTVAIDFPVKFGAYTHIYKLHDNGNGGLSAPPFEINASVSHPTWPGSTKVNGITGTIDYTTGACSVELSRITGEEKFKKPHIEKVWK